MTCEISPRNHIRQCAKMAWDIFANIEAVHRPVLVPARIRYEIMNHQARTSLALNDLDAFCDLFEQGMYGATFLHSDQRRCEILSLYKEAQALWSDEKRLHSLTDLLLERNDG